MPANVSPAPVSITWDSAPVRQQFGDCRVVFDGVATVGAKRYRVNVSATRGARKPEIVLRHVGGAKGGQALPESQLIDVRDIIVLAATLHLKPMRDAIVAACREGRESEIVSPVDPDRDITADGVTSGLTGPDWEPSADMRFFAQRTDKESDIGFGATRDDALAALARVPVLVANTTRACYWRTQGGFYIATGPSVRASDVSDTGAGYARLDSLMRLKGESEGTINRAIDAMGEPAPVDPAPVDPAPELESGLIDPMGELRGTGLIVPVDPAPVRLRQTRGPDGQSILVASPAPVDPAPALGEIGIASIRRALTLAHGALSPANNSEERQALAALDMALALPAIRQGASA